MGDRILISVDTAKPLPKIAKYSGSIYVEPATIEESLRFIQANFSHATICVNAKALSGSDTVEALDGGATKIIISQAQFDEIYRSGQVQDAERLIVALEGPLSQVQGAAQDVSVTSNHSSIYLPGVETLSVLRDVKKLLNSTKAYVSLKENTVEGVQGAIQAGCIPIVPVSALEQNAEVNSHAIDPAALLLSTLKTDRPDGLFTTIVCDERGISLGLVYSSVESIRESLKTGRGVYQSRERGLWYKGETSGDIQELIRIQLDCDGDALLFVVSQKGQGKRKSRRSSVADSLQGFCHLKTATCFGDYSGLSRLEKTLNQRRISAPPGSYTARLFSEPKLLQAKIMEEASELCEAQSKEDVAAEAADLIYFALTKCNAAGVSLCDIEKNLDLKSLKTSRRKGDAKPEWAQKVGLANGAPSASTPGGLPNKEVIKEAASIPKSKEDQSGLKDGRIQMTRYDTASTESTILKEALKRPSQRSTDEIMNIVKPIIERVQTEGDSAVLEYTHRFEIAISLKSPVLHAPFPRDLMQLPQETIAAIDTSFNNIKRFHAAQKEEKPLQVETMPGVVCSRFSKPIERVGLYVPGGTAVLPSTALMLGVPAMVAGCKNIVLASPPRADGTLTPEVVYAAHKVGAESIVLAGGAQAVAAMAYGTQSITKVDKILGPGNQFVTAAKMLVSNDTTARVAIDMPAGPSEVLVVADETANPAFVAADLLSQAEHGVDSQVVCIAVDLNEAQLQAIEDELHKQANALPRVDIVRGAIEHSVTLVTKDIHEAMRLSNEYAPEHLILQVKEAEKILGMVENAGSVFVGKWTPESVGDYSAGVNHSLRRFILFIALVFLMLYLDFCKFQFRCEN